MKQLLATIILCSSFVFSTLAQITEEAEEQYWNFAESRGFGDYGGIIGQGEKLLPKDMADGGVP